ncbi:MAG TPA: DoxX family protein [Chloroflexota bacterium]|nr:DoxX family protein [Chloroflexota bacterium]
MIGRGLTPAWGITLVRMMMGIILIVASYEKLSAGGFFGFSASISNFGLPLPQFFGPFITGLELVGGILLLTGLGARWVAILFVCEFAVNVFILKIPRQPPFGGWDSMRIDLMMLATAIALVLVGPGELALENLLLRRRSARSMQTASQYR